MNKIIRHGMCVLVAAFALQIHAQDTEVKDNAPPKGLNKNTAVLPVQKLENDFYDWHQRHKQVVALIAKRPVDMIFIGDSITHMFGGLPKSPIARGHETWDRYYGHRNAVNMGFGWDRTQNVLWRLTHGELDGIKPKVAVVLIGTNNRTGTKNARQNTPAEIADGVTAICRIIHEKTPTCKILLLGVLPRSPEHFVKSIQELNRLLASLHRKKYITFLNMWDQFADETGLPKKNLMCDTVHPNAAGYQRWAEAMEPVLSKLLKDKAVKPRKPQDMEGN